MKSSAAVLFVLSLLISIVQSADDDESASSEPMLDRFLATVVRGYHNFVKGFSSMSPAAQFIVGSVTFLVVAGFLGLDGGKPPAKPEIPLEDAKSEKNPRVFLDIEIDGAKEGRIVLELFAGTTPITAENFRALCTGEKGMGKCGKKLHYKGSVFHRIIPNFMAQGGDFVNGNGSSGESIYGKKFEDEISHGHVAHSVPFLLSCANSGPHTNASQFFISMCPCPWLDRKHVVFGAVEDGFSVIEAIEKVGTTGMGEPKAKVVIANCGEIKKDKTN